MEGATRAPRRRWSKSADEGNPREHSSHTPIRRCQIHKARNIVERLPKHLHGPIRKALRVAWAIDDAHRAERLIRNLVRRLEREAPKSLPWLRTNLILV
ncbi:transposase [Bradyrhizobium yuanmingense]|uniref:transposase n=1 Tax=Bradyrhizobium yuanmingense TaxID=108015 RepID=UPI0023B8A5CA|nr:transposase [Bradyrhizobium yuanmingense]MDF0523422.1 transposase [Bradyrhizobium yuanmingense]